MTDQELGPRLDPLNLPSIQSFINRLIPGPSNVDVPIGVFEYLRLSSNVEVAVAFGRLFWPEFVDYRGVILLRDAYGVTGFERGLANGFSLLEAQRSANRVRVWDLFCNNPGDIDSSVFVDLAITLKIPG